MTCIVGVETENSVIIAGDSGSSTRNTIDPTRLKKVFLKKYPSENENNKMIIGYSSSFRMGQLLEYKLNIPEQEPFTLDLEYLSTVFIDEVRKVLKKGGFTKIENNEESGGFFLVGYKGKIYEVNSDFQVNSSSRGFSAVGSGKYFALGALSVLLENSVDPEEACLTSLGVAEEFNPNVRGPFIVERV